MINIRKYDSYIVRCRNMYLFGVDRGKLDLRPYYYDAWRTRRVQDARRVAARIGGKVVRFNPAEGSVA